MLSTIFHVTFWELHSTYRLFSKDYLGVGLTIQCHSFSFQRYVFAGIGSLFSDNFTSFNV